MLPFAFESGMGFERYVDYALDVPMYFVKRGDIYHDVAGARFRDLLAGRLEALPGERATISDWANHLSTIFPEVRLKRYLEMRGADVGPAARICALSALMVGLYYDSRALDGALELVGGWSAEERQKLRDDVPRVALGAKIAGRNLADVGREILELARAGLARRARRNIHGRDETFYLDPLDAFVATGRVAAQDWIARFEGEWGGVVDPAFTQACY
jgi:glutamate--cysteine ligase